MKPIRIIVAGAIALGCVVGVNYWNTPERQRERELDRKAAYLLEGLSIGDKANYSLSSGSVVGVKRSIPHLSDRALELTVGGTSFTSNSWRKSIWTYSLFDGPDEDARVLNQITISDDKTFESVTLELDQIPDYPERQREYEKLIDETAAAKKAGMEAKEKQD
jgi:hypothetical protein